MLNFEEELKKNVQEITNALKKELTIEELTQLKIKFLGKKSFINTFVKNHFRKIPDQEKKRFGKLINENKEKIANLIEQKINICIKKDLLKKMETKKQDVSIAPIELPQGSIHPLNLIIQDIEDFFLGEGFLIAEGPELEKDLYNFEMVNMPKNHIARDMHDSFYINENLLLRTHTSPVQIRTMLKNKNKPIAIISPGKVYRRDREDQTHTAQFTQLECLMIGKNINLGHLKNILLKMIKFFFGNEYEIRMRPSYFPFTEPSVEVDLVYKNQKGEKVFVEILGAGLVHPNVLTMAGFDKQKFTGFAFGAGIERIAMFKYQILDIRSFYNNDIRFLKKF